MKRCVPLSRVSVEFRTCAAHAYRFLRSLKPNFYLTLNGTATTLAGQVFGASKRTEADAAQRQLRSDARGCNTSENPLVSGGANRRSVQDSPNDLARCRSKSSPVAAQTQLYSTVLQVLAPEQCRTASWREGDVRGAKLFSCTGTRLRLLDEMGAGTPKCGIVAGHPSHVTRGLSWPSRALHTHPARRSMRAPRARVKYPLSRR